MARDLLRTSDSIVGYSVSASAKGVSMYDLTRASVDLLSRHTASVACSGMFG